jgi:putative signal transducing protein
MTNSPDPDSKSSNSGETAWVVVYTTSNTMEAHIIAGRLESEGIPAMVHQAPGASAYGLTVGLFGALRVLVLGVDYDRALALLEEEPPELLPDDSNRIIFGDDFEGDDEDSEDFEDDYDDDE